MNKPKFSQKAVSQHGSEEGEEVAEHSEHMVDDSGIII